MPALDNNELVLRYQTAYVDKLLPYSLNYPQVLYGMNNETGEDVEWSDFWARYVRSQAAASPLAGYQPQQVGQIANQLKMAVVHAILTLAQLGWSQRRIAGALGVDRETVPRYVHSPPADSKPATNPIPGSPVAEAPLADKSSGPERLCEPFRAVIEAKLGQGLTGQRIYQDLVEGQMIVIDNLKAAVNRADWYDPEVHPKIQSFCQHYGSVGMAVWYGSSTAR